MSDKWARRFITPLVNDAKEKTLSMNALVA